MVNALVQDQGTAPDTDLENPWTQQGTTSAPGDWYLKNWAPKDPQPISQTFKVEAHQKKHLITVFVNQGGLTEIH